MDSLEETLRYPTKRENWIRTVLIGGLLIFFSWLVVPLVAAYGYAVRVIQQTTAGETEPPAFDEWGALLVDGLQALVVGFIYLLIPVVVATITIGGALVSFAAGTVTGEGAALAAGGLAFGLTVSTILALVFGYVAIAAIVNFAREGDLAAAFDFQLLRQVVLTREYAVPWLVSIAILLVVGIVASIPVIGWLLAPFVSFYGLVVAATLWADGFSAALRREPDAGDVSGREQAI